MRMESIISLLRVAVLAFLGLDFFGGDFFWNTYPYVYM